MVGTPWFSHADSSFAVMKATDPSPHTSAGALLGGAVRADREKRAIRRKRSSNAMHIFCQLTLSAEALDDAHPLATQQRSVIEPPVCRDRHDPGAEVPGDSGPAPVGDGAARASWSASSARSNEPATRISGAIIRGGSSHPFGPLDGLVEIVTPVDGSFARRANTNDKAALPVPLDQSTPSSGGHKRAPS